MEQQETQTTTANQGSTYTSDEVRDEQDEVELENASAVHSTKERTNSILKEAGVVGGSDNTATPAGGNSTHAVHRDHITSVHDSVEAQEEFEGDEPSGTGAADS
jgi:hypothetical protein